MTPEGWRIGRVREICDVVTGSTPKTSRGDYWGGDIPFVTPTDLGSSRFVRATQRHVTEEGLAKSREVPPNSVLVTCIASLGKSAMTTRPCCTNQQINAVIPKIGQDPAFLYYALTFSAPRLRNLAGQTAVLIINKRTFGNFELLLPPLPEQRKIAAILSSVDDAIEKTQAVIEQVQVVKRGLMQKLLTRGLPGRHTRFKQTEIGEIPHDWRLTVLGEALEGIDAGWSPKCEGRPAASDEWGVLKVSSVSGGRFKQHENKALTSGLAPRSKIQVADGDVLVARASGVLDLVGCAVYVHRTRSRLMLSDKTLRLRAERAVARPMFLNILLNAPRIRRQVLERTTGSHMRNISQRALRRVPVPLPSLEEQEKIEMLEVQASTRLREERRCLEQLGMMKSALMSVLLTGELRVTPDTEAA